MAKSVAGTENLAERKQVAASGPVIGCLLKHLTSGFDNAYLAFALLPVTP
jgi:hypothetical protein